MGTARQYHKNCIQGVLQKNIKRVAQSNVLPGQSKKKYRGLSQSEILPGTAIIKSTGRDRHNQKYCQGVS